jgi:GNAT superfamily N-acetyltransferase
MIVPIGSQAEAGIAVEIVALQIEHVEEAGRLVSERYRRLRRALPLLPERYEQPSAWASSLEGILSSGPGVAAMRGAKLVGFLAGWQIARLRGQPAVYSPEWGNAVEAAGDSGRVYQEMYSALSARWVADGCLSHYITLLPEDGSGVEAWRWMGFGHYVVDAVRGLEPVEDHTSTLPVRPSIRRATQADLAQVAELRDGLRQHLRSAPTFLYLNPDDPDDCEKWVNDPALALWLAFDRDQAVASLGLGPASEDACTIIRDKGTASITHAFTRPAARGSGLATALLNRALEWARAEGYTRCAVDFEAANVLAARFWLSHFQPVALSFYRQIHAR